MSAAMRQLTAKLRTQLDAAPWLRWALVGVGVLSAIYALQALDRLRLDAQRDSIAAEARARQIRSLEGQDVWFARQEESLRLKDSLLAQIPTSPTPGIAQAALQSWLGDLTKSVGDSSSVRITVENAAPVETIPGLVRFRATLRGGITPREALNLLRQVESSRNLMVVETMDIRSDTNRIATITVNAFYRMASAPAPAPTPQAAQ